MHEKKAHTSRLHVLAHTTVNGKKSNISCCVVGLLAYRPIGPNLKVSMGRNHFPVVPKSSIYLVRIRLEKLKTDTHYVVRGLLLHGNIYYTLSENRRNK